MEVENIQINNFFAGFNLREDKVLKFSFPYTTIIVLMHSVTVSTVHGTFGSFQSVPHFVEPTLRDGGQFQCLLHGPCHLMLWAVNDALTKDW